MSVERENDKRSRKYIETINLNTRQEKKNYAMWGVLLSGSDRKEIKKGPHTHIKGDDDGDDEYKEHC